MKRRRPFCSHSHARLKPWAGRTAPRFDSPRPNFKDAATPLCRMLKEVKMQLSCRKADVDGQRNGSLKGLGGGVRVDGMRKDLRLTGVVGG